MRSTLVRALVIASLAAACSSPAGTGSPAAPSAPAGSGPAVSHHLTILGAASLKSVLDEAKVGVRGGKSGDDPGHLHGFVVGDRGADRAGRLRGRLPLGGHREPAEARGRRLRRGRRRSSSPANELTIVVPTDNPAGIESWQDLAEDGLKVIAAGEEVPITKYADQLVGNLAALPDAPAGFAAAYAANIVSREENVKALIAKIELGEGDAGIVYVTDASGVDQGLDRRGARRGKRSGDLRGRRRQGFRRHPASGGLPRLVRRTGRAGDPRAVRIPAATRRDERGSAASRASRREPPRSRRRSRTHRRRRHVAAGAGRAVRGLPGPAGRHARRSLHPRRLARRRGGEHARCLGRSA